MGRKGVSKRKSTQTKNKPLAGGAASGTVSSVMQAAEKQPVSSHDTGKVVSSTKGDAKHSSDGKKKSRKG